MKEYEIMNKEFTDKFSEIFYNNNKIDENGNIIPTEDISIDEMINEMDEDYNEVVGFEQNEKIVEKTSNNHIVQKYEDVKAFNQSIDERREIFLERRNIYGNHINNAKRFPLINIAGLYEKCVRTIIAIENDLHNIPKDTLLDLGNFADMVNSEQNDRKNE